MGGEEVPGGTAGSWRTSQNGFPIPFPWRPLPRPRGPAGLPLLPVVPIPRHPVSSQRRVVPEEPQPPGDLSLPLGENVFFLPSLPPTSLASVCTFVTKGGSCVG